MMEGNQVYHALTNHLSSSEGLINLKVSYI